MVFGMSVIDVENSTNDLHRRSSEQQLILEIYYLAKLTNMTRNGREHIMCTMYIANIC